VDHLTPSWTALLDLFRPCFRAEVFATFSLMLPAWIVCLGRRTISRVWETTGQADQRSHCPAFRLFSDAQWNWDELARIFLIRLLAVCVPGTRVWLVVDDTLCHKRGAKVAFGGIYLDAVLSSKRHKVFRFGLNWVTLGLVVQLPFRPDRPFCLNFLWRLGRKKGSAPAGVHRTKPQLAREMVAVVAGWLPQHRLVVLGDGAYMGKALLRGLPDQVSAVGPIHRHAVLTHPLAAGYQGRRKKGTVWTTPSAALAEDAGPWQDLRLHHAKGVKELRVRVLRPCCWYAVTKDRPLQVVLVRDPATTGKVWRSEALLSLDLTLSAAEVLNGYLQRWSVEVAYAESKQQLGLHDPMVWNAQAVERAHPLAWFVGSLVVLWYATAGQAEPAAQRHRPWYLDRVTPTFADMLWACRLHLWVGWLASEPAEWEEKWVWLLEYLATAA
jgi:DDE superfamily endonuclease